MRYGGGSGIRTHGELAPTPVFKTGALNRSAIPPSTYKRCAFLILRPVEKCRLLRTLQLFAFSIAAYSRLQRDVNLLRYVGLHSRHHMGINVQRDFDVRIPQALTARAAKQRPTLEPIHCGLLSPQRGDVLSTPSESPLPEATAFLFLEPEPPVLVSGEN